MRVFVSLTMLAWFALFASVNAFDIGLVAALLSFIGFCIAFLTARKLGWSIDWAIGAVGAIITPLLGALVAEAWISLFPAPPCVGDDCVSVTIKIPAQL